MPYLREVQCGDKYKDIGKLLKRNMFKSLKGDRASNVFTHANKTEVVVQIFGAEWGTGVEHSRKTHICEGIESNNQL